MANNDLLKQIERLIKDEIRPVKELIEILKDKIDQIELFQNVTMNQVRTIKDQQSVINEKLDRHSAALINIESKLNAYGDMYKINDSNIRKMQKRLETIEKKNKIQVPPELKLAEIADL